jgi:hypothetical protein
MNIGSPENWDHISFQNADTTAEVQKDVLHFEIPTSIEERHALGCTAVESGRSSPTFRMKDYIHCVTSQRCRVQISSPKPIILAEIFCSFPQSFPVEVGLHSIYFLLVVAFDGM